MALTKEEREARIKINEMLDRYSEDIGTMFDDIVPITEANNRKVSSLADLQKLMDEYKDRLAFLGSNEFTKECSCDINISILLMSTKTVTVPEDDNLLTLGYSFSDRDGSIGRVSIYTNNRGKSASLEEFMEFPIKPDVKDEVSARDLVRRCDASQFYKLYQDEALSIIRKLFPYPYGMFTGPHLYKKEDKNAGTLYVAYDKFRKKFRYAYNPDFILESAIEEWMLNRRRYKSLKDCYCYLLAFMITHEMLHIIHHNTVSDSDLGVDDSRLSTSDHEVANCVMDSFINCKIARRFTGAPQLRSSGSELAPMLSNGIGSKVSVRVEHNKGLKKFDTLKTLADELAKTILKDLRASSASIDYSYGEIDLSNRDISKYEGADAFITVNISPTLSTIRSNGSNLFQTCFNDIIKCITDGKVYDRYSKVSDSEKISDLDILPVGTIVMVRDKGRTIGIITSIESDNVTYGVNVADMSGVKVLKHDQNGDLCVPEYVDSGRLMGKFSRVNIRPYNPEDDVYYDNAPDNKQDKLSTEDLMSLAMPSGNQGSPQDVSNEKPVKAIKVGDVVWVRKAKKFGRVLSIDNGKFNIEEVIEKPCKVIDDSDNYT